MATLVGVAIEALVVRAAYRNEGRMAFVEHAWDGLQIERVVDALRSSIGKTRGIVLSVGLGFLEVAKPALPTMPDGDRRRVLLRDADRYFPMEGALAIGCTGSGGLAFATSSEQLQRWTRAFEEWAPVRAVVAGPDAIAAGITSSGSFVVDAGADEQGLLQLVNGEVREARRIPLHTASVVAAGATSLLTAGSESAPGKYSAALGALSFAHVPLEMMLLDAGLESSLRSARTRRRWMSYGVAALALLVVGAATSNRRDETLRATQHAVDSLQTVAVPGLASKARLNQLNEEATILSAHAAPANDPLHVLATISASLPRDAFVQRLEWDGREWRLDGSVNQAASVVPHLDSARLFSSVRVLGASTRFRDGPRMRESFSVAFQVKGDSIAQR